MLLPKKIQKGDTIGFFSPSSPATVFAPTRLNRAAAFLEQKGFKLYAGNLTGKKNFYRSGTIQERAEELNELIRNPTIRCIISVIGGSNSNSILPYLDYEALKKDPKIIIGYSVVTAILLAIYQKTNLITFYGPALVASFGEIGWFVEQTFSHFESILINKPSIPFTIKNPPFWTDEFIDWESQSSEKTKTPNNVYSIGNTIVKGRLIGGNLNTILGIFGSDYMPTIKQGDILLIEDSLKSAEIIEKLFSHLKLNGVFDRIAGLVLGKHEKFNDNGTGKQPIDILLEVIKNLTFPILINYDCCYTHPMITLPIGINTELNPITNELTLLENWIA